MGKKISCSSCILGIQYGQGKCLQHAKCKTCGDTKKVIGDCWDSPNVWFDPCPDCDGSRK